MKKRMSSVLVVLFWALLIVPSSANAESRVSAFTVGQPYYYLNGQSLSMDTSPFTYNNRVYVPAQYLVNSIGARGASFYMGLDNTVSIEADGKTLVFAINSNIFTVNGESRIMDAPPLLVNGVVFLPAVYVAAQYGSSINWAPATQTITISYQNSTSANAGINTNNYIAALRANETTGVITLDARIQNAITEIQIHKLRIESESAFHQQINNLILVPPSGGMITLQAKTFNQTCLSLLSGSITDDQAIAELKQLLAERNLQKNNSLDIQKLQILNELLKINNR